MVEGPTPQRTGGPPTTAVGRDRLRRLAPYGVGAAVAVGAIALYGVLAPSTPPVTRQNVSEAIASALASVTPAPAWSQLVYQAVQPSLVLVETTAPPGAGADDEGGLGSGVVVTIEGDILTSLHVVEHAADIELTFIDGSTSPADIVETLPEKDIAVLRATNPPPTMIPATLGNPATVQQGSEAYALGSPFGLYGSVTSGVISGLDRTFTMPDSGRQLTGLFQIDAAVNPGSSGGALVNRSGQVIGIVTALVNPTEQQVFVGIGLAVPIDVAGGAAGLPPY